MVDHGLNARKKCICTVYIRGLTHVDLTVDSLYVFVSSILVHSNPHSSQLRRKDVLINIPCAALHIDLKFARIQLIIE